MENYNFNDPFEFTEIFRVITHVVVKNEDDEEEDHIPFIPEKINPADMREFSFKHSVGWEDIKAVKEYMHADDWSTNNRGPKFYIRLQGKEEDTLVLGNYKSMVDHWRMFRNKYPLFVERE